MLWWLTLLGLGGSDADSALPSVPLLGVVAVDGALVGVVESDDALKGRTESDADLDGLLS